MELMGSDAHAEANRRFDEKDRSRSLRFKELLRRPKRVTSQVVRLAAG